jgi:hypothetical protein
VEWLEKVRAMKKPPTMPAPCIRAQHDTWYGASGLVLTVTKSQVQGRVGVKSEKLAADRLIANRQQLSSMYYSKFSGIDLAVEHNLIKIKPAGDR